MASLDEYILGHIDPEPEYLRRLYRATQVHLLRGRMASGHLQGRLLKMLVQLSGAKRILEIGTFSGYATICLSEGLPADGVVHTFEVNDEQEDFTRPWLEGRYDHCGMADEVFSRIRFHIGDARTLLPEIDEPFDLAFIDGDKRQYIECYELVMSHMRPGGLILADNT
ncbi:MAG: class I SAM-dependent methyltransferase, partial [Bacteroidaceae bacterium]|nr:class I SAM-dependent methyltransferase [Bacteroidaceae bacterium]